MTNFVTPPPPPPMSSGGTAVKAGPIGWGAVAAGVFGFLALVLPWFKPKLSKPVAGIDSLGASSYHAWSSLLFLAVGPIFLILFGVLWFQAMRGQQNSRFANSADPIRSMSIQSVGVGVIALVLGLISFPLMKTHYKNWNLAAKEFKSAGATLEQNPQAGLYLLFLGAILMIVVGVLGLVMKPAPAVASPMGFNGPPQGFGAPRGFGPPAGFDGPAQDGSPAGGFPPPPPPAGY